MADPRAEMAALRGLGVPPPGRAKPPQGTEPAERAHEATSEATDPVSSSAPQRATTGAARKRGRPTRRPGEQQAAPKASRDEGRSGTREQPASDAPPDPRSAVERRSRHTTVYLDAAARSHLEGRLGRDPDLTVADAMLDAVRSSVRTLREQRPARVEASSGDLPPPPRRRRRRRVDDGRAVPVRFSPAELEALEGLGEELDLSISGLISEALITSGAATSGGTRRSTAKRGSS